MISIPRAPFTKQGISGEKLASILTAKGFGAETYTIRPDVILTQNPPVAQLLNRIRAYNNQGESIPLFLIKVRIEDNSEALYVTKNPPPSTSLFGWDEDQITPVDASALASSGALKVGDRNKYAALSRAELKRRYFDRRGGLLVRKFPSLNTDADFIHGLLQKGFYVRYGDESGYLFIE